MENQEESELLIDNYEHVIISEGEPVLYYTPVNIPGPGIDLNLFESSFQGCLCSSSNCTSLNCTCLFQNGIPHYSSTFRLLSSSNNVIYECHENCSCDPSNCANRLVQKGPNPDLDIFLTDSKGYGVKCNKDLLEGSFVCEYAGEVINSEEAKRRFQSRKKKNEKNYIFCLREHFGVNLKETWIDPTWIGNIGRYLNHSCEANLQIVPVRVGIDVPKICLFAKRFIGAGTELTFDYGENSSSCVTIDNGRSVCRCGAEKCRGYLPFDDSLL